MNMDFNISNSDRMMVSVKKETIEDKLYHYHIEIEAVNGERIHFDPVSISWLLEVPGVVGSWNPGANLKKNLRHEWEPPMEVKGTHLSPLICYYGKGQQNCYTLAYSHVIEPLQLDLEINEATGGYLAKLNLFTTLSKEQSSYKGIIRIDLRSIPYYESIGEVTKWYNSMEAYQALEVPSEAYEPLYSTWYNFHQEISQEAIEEECKRAVTLGFKTIVVDDGWQTDDKNRGYAYTGDWNLCRNKMGDMQSHVKRVQDMGLKYMVWFSVPYIGKKAEAWKRFGHKVLYFHEEHQAAILDLRYPDVRSYLIDKYAYAMKAWGLDGLKLDFIDRFEQLDDQVHEEMDYQSVQEAVDVFLTEAREAILDINPQAMIEFRQRYIGPAMRNKGNIFRVHDCPYDSVVNRVGITDLRMTSGNTAIHSDMVMWNEKDTVENAALQMINILHGVPQYSMLLKDLPEDHYEMSRFYLKLWKEYRDVLLFGEMIPYEPELNYPHLLLQNDNTHVHILSSPKVITLEEHVTEYIVVNGTMQEEFVIKAPKDFIGTMVGYTVTGHKIVEEDGTIRKLQEVHIPKSGVLKIFRQHG